MNKFLRCTLNFVVIVALACLWLALSATPVWAQTPGAIAVTPAQEATDTVNYNRANLFAKDFSGADLAGRSFVAARMKEANFAGANLTNALMTQGYLVNANFHDANLSGVLLDQAELTGADLTNAILVDATITRTTLKDARITGADFTNTVLDRYQVTQLCQRAEGINPVTQVTTKESLDCP